MESIKKLREICQSPKDVHNYNGLFNYFRVRIWRVPSIYITKLLLYTPITPNQVTMLMIFIGFIVTYLFSLGSYWSAIIGVLLLEFVYILDAVDGEIARYKKQTSVVGIFLDLMVHVSNVSIIFIGITIGLYRLNPSLEIVALGLSASLFSLAHLDIQPLKHHAFFLELIYYAKGKKEYKLKEKKGSINKEIRRVSLPRRLFKNIINPLYDNFLITNIILIAAIFNKFYWVLVFYGITFPVIWLIKLFYEYKTGYKDYEYLLKPYKK